MPYLSFDSSPQISSTLALLFVLVLSLALGWFTIIASENIVQSVKASPVVHIENRGVPLTDVKGKK
jgi:hypothetical protein